VKFARGCYKVYDMVVYGKITVKFKLKRGVEDAVWNYNYTKLPSSVAEIAFMSI
jgi:hypothetical protein